MGAKFLDSIPHRSFPFQVGPLNNIFDLTMTVAQVDATEFGSSRIIVTEQKPTKGTEIAIDRGRNRDLSVYEDDKNVTGHIHIKTEMAQEFPFATTFFQETTAMALIAVSERGARTAVLDYASTFPSAKTGHSFRDNHFAIFLSGIQTYIMAVNAGHVASPLSNIIIALDETAYAMWQQKASELENAHLRFDSPTKRRLLQKRQLLEGIHLNLGVVESWLPYITQDCPNYNKVMRNVILSCLAHDERVRRKIEEWDDFDVVAFDGNYAEILDTRAMRESWDGLMQLLANHTIQASKLVDHLQTSTDPFTATMIKNRLLMLANSDPG